MIIPQITICSVYDYVEGIIYVHVYFGHFELCLVMYISIIDYMEPLAFGLFTGCVIKFSCI